MANGNEYDVTAIAFLFEGERIASGVGESRILIWDTGSGEQFGVLSGHTGTVTALSKCEKLNCLVSGSWDGSVRLWDLKEEKELAKYTGHKTEVTLGLC